MAFLLTFPLFLVKGIKWKILMKSDGINLGLLNAFMIYLVGFSVGLITPAKIGDFSRSLYIRKENELTLGRAVTSVFLDRAIDVGMLFLLSVLGITIFVFFYNLNFSMLLLIVIAFVGFLCLLLLVAKREILRKILSPFYKFFVPEQYKEESKNSFHDFYEALPKILGRKKRLGSVLVLTLFSWLIVILEYYILNSGLSMGVSYSFLILAIPVALLLEILPISFSGIGTREAGLVLLLSLVGISKSMAISFAIIILVFNYAVGVLGLVIWFKKPLPISLR